MNRLLVCGVLGGLFLVGLYSGLLNNFTKGPSGNQGMALLFDGTYGSHHNRVQDSERRAPGTHSQICNDEIASELGTRFNDFFENEKVTTFRKGYVDRLVNGSIHRHRKKIYAGVMEGQSGGHLQNGFGSVFNTMLLAYAVASRQEVHRIFQIFQPASFKHSHLREFFEDFAENSTFPIFPVLGDIDLDVILNKSENYSIELVRTVPPAIVLKGPDLCALRYIHDQYSHVWDIFFNLAKDKEEFQKIFQAKSDMTQALWNLRPALKTLVRSLWCAIKDSSGRYLAIHLRRTDKIATGEMEDIPVELYYNETLRYCQNVSRSCPTTIFVMSDDHGAHLTFKKFATPKFQVLGLSDLLDANGLNRDEYISCLPGSQLHHLLPGTNYTRSAWHKHTREILISVTLLAMSEHLICTFSSNICKMTVYLRGDYSENFVYSLDKPWDPL